MAGKSTNNDDLRVYFKSLKTSQKKEFIENFKEKISTMKSARYSELLSEFIQEYNKEVRARKESAAKEASQPDISAESFAIALASMLSGASDVGKPQLVGTWQREFDDKTFFYKFNEDGTFVTNTVNGRKTLEGNYKLGIDGAILMEPHELLQISSLILSVSGSGLTIGLTDGSIYDYKRKKEHD